MICNIIHVCVFLGMQNLRNPGVGKYCIPLYLGLNNNNYAPSFLISLCGIGGDCFGPRDFNEGAQLPKKNTEVQNNHRRIQTMTETKMVLSYYLVIISFWGSFYYILTF